MGDIAHYGLDSRADVEVERHLHNYERWLEAAAVASGETHVADRLAEGGGAFQADAGNDTWGTWLQVVGSSDTPVISGSTKFDVHRISIAAYERNNTIYAFQVGFGASGAAALAAGTVTEFPILSGTGVSVVGPFDALSRRWASGTKVWVRLNCPGQDTATLDFFVGIHEYQR